MESNEKNTKVKPSFVQNAKLYFLEFCDRTSLHGFNFLGEPKRGVLERIWWATIISVSIYFCIAMVYQSFYKWQHSPVIVSFATEYNSIWQIPFPAVTICPEIKAAKERYNYTDYYLKKKAGVNLTEEENTNFEYMALLCDPDEDLLGENLTTVDVDALNFLYDVQTNFADNVLVTRWKGKEYSDNNVSEIFRPIITSQGFCHTFNFMDRSEFFTDNVYHFKDTFTSNGKTSQWSVEKGYSDDANISTYPRRTVISGTNGGLNVILHTSREDIDQTCGEAFQGFRVVVHSPDRIPRVKQQYFRLPLDKSVVVGIKPRMMTTSADLRAYKPSDRHCYFDDEKRLQFFKVYNQENCMLECLANFTLSQCGCVSIHSPREKSTPFCGAAIDYCLEKAKTKFTANQGDPKTRCDCMPACNTLDYDLEISYSNWNWRPYMEIEKGFREPGMSDDDYLLSNKSHCSQLVIFYKDMKFITSERNELYAIADFLSNCGGLLGLFTGATFISLFEVIYYLTLRLVFNIHMFGRRYWSGSEKLLSTKKRND